MERVDKKTGTAATDKLETLKKVPFFAGLGESMLHALLSSCIEKHYAKGQTIFCEGEPCAGLLIVHQGAVKIFKLSDQGRELVLAIERRFRSIAELPVFDEGGYPASAVAMEDSTLLFLPKPVFKDLCYRNPEIALRIVKSVSARLRQLVTLVEEITFKQVSHRLARVLLDMAREHGQDTPAGRVFTLNMTNQELASLIGTVRELVSRTLSQFHTQGLIRLEGRKITLPDPERLRHEMDRPA